MSPNDRRLFTVLEDVLLIDAAQYDDDMGPDEINTWDSLATVRIARGVEEEFGYRMKPYEIATVSSIGEIREFLRREGVQI
jgi:acyl carrier protein